MKHSFMFFFAFFLILCILSNFSFSLPSIFQLMKLLNSLDVVMPDTILGKQLDMINRNLVSAQYLLRFMNIHLKNISGKDN